MKTFELTRSDGGKSVMMIVAGANLADEIAKWQESAGGVTIVSSREMTAAEVSTHRGRREAERLAAANVPTIADRLTALEGRR